MKTTPQPDVQNVRIIHFVRQFVLLPFTIAMAAYRWVKARLEGLHSDKVLREKDQVRQSRARRELRGLPPDHDPSRASRP